MKSSIRTSRGGRSISFRGGAARRAFEAITGAKLPTPLAIGDRVCVGITEPVAVGVLTAIDHSNTAFPYEVEWTREDGTKYRSNCTHQIIKWKQ